VYTNIFLCFVDSTDDMLRFFLLGHLQINIHNYFRETIIYLNDKAIPIQAWTSPEGPRKVRLPDFNTIGKLRW